MKKFRQVFALGFLLYNIYVLVDLIVAYVDARKFVNVFFPEKTIIGPGNLDFAISLGHFGILHSVVAITIPSIAVFGVICFFFKWYEFSFIAATLTWLALSVQTMNRVLMGYFLSNQLWALNLFEYTLHLLFLWIAYRIIKINVAQTI